MTCTLDANNAVMSAALRHAMAECQRLEQAIQRTAHFALLGRLAVGILHEIRSYGTPRGQSGDHPMRRCAKGNAAPPGPLAGRRLVACARRRDGMPTPAEKCRHCLAVRSVQRSPSQPIACRAERGWCMVSFLQ